MKALRVIGNIFISIILFSLIFTLTITRSTKTFLEKDVVLGVVKDSITESIQKGTGKITEKSKELLDDMLKDKDVSNIIRLVIDNFEEYQNNRGNFKVSDADVEKIYTYAMKYKQTIIEISGEKLKNISDEEFKKLFSSENINDIANEVFGSIEKDLGDDLDLAVKIYEKATSKTVMIVLISLIAFFMILLFLVNWSLYRWMLPTGIVLIVSGVLVSFIFVAGLLMNDIINSVNILKDKLEDISLAGYIIWGSCEIVIGIILIILYNVFKNKKSKSILVTPTNEVKVDNNETVEVKENISSNETVEKSE